MRRSPRPGPALAGSRAPWLAPAVTVAALTAIHFAVRDLAARTDDLYAAWLAGARVPVLLASQPWRLVTAPLIHLDPGHLAANGAALLLLGTLCVRLCGAARFFWVLVVTAVAGSAAGALVGESWSLGVSGGAFGLLGLLCGVALRRWSAWEDSERRRFLSTALPWALFLGLVPLLAPQVGADHTAHLAGLAAGAALGATSPRPLRGMEGGLAVAATLLLGLSVTLGLQHARRQTSPPEAWTDARSLGLTYPVPSDWAPTAPPDARVCAQGHTNGLVVFCAGAGVDAGDLERRLVTDAAEAGFEPDAAPLLTHPDWPLALGFHPAPGARRGQRLGLLLDGPGPVRRVLLVHVLSPAALDARTRAVLAHVAGHVKALERAN